MYSQGYPEKLKSSLVCISDIISIITPTKHNRNTEIHFDPKITYRSHSHDSDSSYLGMQF